MPDIFELLGLKRLKGPPDEIEMQDMSGAEQERARTDRARKTIAYAQKNEPAEALRILARVVADLQELADGPRSVTPKALIAQARDAMTTLQATVRKSVANDCIRWTDRSLALAKPTKDTPDARKAHAHELLEHINQVEQGVAAHRELLARVAKVAPDPDLASLLPLLDEQDQAVAAARAAWEKLLPRRSSDQPPSKAPPVTRPAPKGVKAPQQWEEACNRIDAAVAKGQAPDDKDLALMAEGAKQALDADADWKWEADLSAKFQRSWDEVKAHYKTLKKTEPAKAKNFMSGYWWFRKITVDALMKELAGTYGFDWESVGSTNLESDYDISVRTHGKLKEQTVWDWQIVDEFNRKLSARFGGVQPGTLFDTNLYASAEPPPLKAEADKSATERDMDAMTEAGQDIGALMKMRRYMSWDDYVGYQDSVLGEVDKAIAAEKDKERAELLQQRRAAAQRQFETADALYFQKVVQTLAKAGETFEADIADSPAGQKKLIEKLEKLEKEPDKLMAANNAAYVEAMKEVRRIEPELKKIDDLLAGLKDKQDEPSAQKRAAATDKRAALMARLETLQADSVFFAAEAYHSKGPLQHIVQAGQKSAQEVKADDSIKGEEAQKKAIAAKVTQRLELLPLTAFMQSFNEQLGDFLKDLKHYDEKSPYPGLGLYRSSKYLERFCEAMVWIGRKLEGDPALKDAAKEFAAIRIAGKAPADVKTALAGLVDLRGGKVEFADVDDPQQEMEAYAMAEAQKIFGSAVKTLRDLGRLATDIGKQVNVVLRRAQLAQQMIAASEKAYFKAGA